MPVNMDPAKKRRKSPPNGLSSSGQMESTIASKQEGTFGEETEEDRVKALADAEKKNLWDATEVIDMDTF